MPESKLHYCDLCRLLIAPNDPSRLERNGRTVHEHCLLDKDMANIGRSVYEFLKQNSGVFTANFFLTEAVKRKVRSRKAMAETIGACLNMAVNQACRQKRTESLGSIETFAGSMSDRLFMDIRVRSGIL